MWRRRPLPRLDHWLNLFGEDEPNPTAAVQPRLMCRGPCCVSFTDGGTIMNKIVTAALVGCIFIGGAGAAAAQPYHDAHGRYAHDNGYHNGWRNDWRRGARMDNDAWRRGARVDWRRHHLRAPPRGYEWREVDGRYVMAAVANGLIADIILNAR